MAKGLLGFRSASLRMDQTRSTLQNFEPPRRTIANADGRGRMSAFGGKADMLRHLHMSAFDPKRTSTANALVLLRRDYLSLTALMSASTPIPSVSGNDT